MTTTEIQSGTWKITMPNGLLVTFRIDVDANLWGMDVQQPGRPRHGISDGGVLNAPGWYPWAVAVGAIPYPDTD